MARFRLLASTVIGALALAETHLVHGAVPPIVFVSRDLAGAPDPDLRSAAIERAHRGRLLILEDGRMRPLIDANDPAVGPETILDVMDPDVSFDGLRIVFAGYSSEDTAWRIFEINADGSGLRQITRSDRDIDLARYGEAAALFESYDDVDPCYLPDGRICFVSTRYPGVAPDGRVRATNLYVVNADRTDLHRITTERFGADTPTVEPSTGRIVYSRWWRSGQVKIDEQQNAGPEPEPEPVEPGSPEYGAVAGNDTRVATTPPAVRGVLPDEFPGVNSWFLAGIDPDGANLAMHSGFRVDRELTQAYRPSFLADGDVLALFIPRTPFIGFPGPNGVRSYRKGPGRPALLGGRNHFEDGSRHFSHASAVPLPDGRLLVSASLGETDFDLFVRDAAVSEDENLEPLFALEATAELDAMPLVARPVPPGHRRPPERPPAGRSAAHDRGGVRGRRPLHLHGREHLRERRSRLRHRERSSGGKEPRHRVLHEPAAIVPFHRRPAAPHRARRHPAERQGRGRAAGWRASLRGAAPAE